jgi:signal transduction histidine kinase
MRQPLASMFALAAAALAEPGLPPAARARLEQMVEQAEWLADMIEHSLQLAAPDAPGAGGAELVRVASDVAAAERMTWPGEVRMVSQPSAVFTDVHPVLLRQMVANLVGNATRAAGPSGTVTIEVGRQRNSALLAVEDTGPRHGGRVECGCGAGGGARVQLWLPLSARLTQAEPGLHTEGNLA